ncbi:MAG: hypothetical protein ACX930_00415 [Erythrobacter sp.]
MTTDRWLLLERLPAVAMVAWLLFMFWHGMGYRGSGWLGAPVLMLLGFSWYCHFQIERQGKNPRDQ